MSLRLDDINMRENAIRLSLQTIDSCLLKLDDQTARNSRALTQLRDAAGLQGSPPPVENPGLVESGFHRLRDKGMSPHRINTPPHRIYNEERLRPFTDYHGGSRQRPPLQHGMSVDRSEFEQRYGGMTGAGRVRCSSLSQSEEAVQLGKKVTLATAVDSHLEAGNPEHRPDFPDTVVPSHLSRSSSGGRSGSLRALSLRACAPLAPIVTPTRLEYTSITDAIDTSCMERPVVYSPPNTPEMKPRSRRGSATGGPTHRKKTGHHHQHRHRHRRRTEATLNEGLRTAEENEHKQMEVCHCLFLTDITASWGAFQRMENYVSKLAVNVVGEERLKPSQEPPRPLLVAPVHCAKSQRPSE